jgi:hypothetical protein
LVATTKLRKPVILQKSDVANAEWHRKKNQLRKSANLKIKLDSSNLRFYISTKLTSQFVQEQNKTHLMDDEEDIEDFLLDSRLKTSSK